VIPHPPSPHQPDPAAALLKRLTTDPRFAPHIAALRRFPPRPARHAPWPAELAPAVREAAAALGIERLYTHQTAAFAAAGAGEHVVQVAGTASGKSLGYLLPLLDSLARSPTARALLVFPTKALAQDQLEALRRWDRALPGAGLRPAAYDGDTPRSARAAVRRDARVVITNPDMLHAGILPRHAAWAPFFAGLTDVVIDEMHVYRGVFGSHVANVLRRLRRIARFHGAQPRFSLTSATIANPGELAAALIGAPATVIDDDGAPRGGRALAIYNPPIVDPRLNLRRGSLQEAEVLARLFLDRGVQTIVFTGSRQRVELLVRSLNEALSDDPLSVAVRGYRGGYTPGERRAIEADLREGRLGGVVATNALELGIDIGGLDACVIAGYPGTIASTWQQAGRAGRRAGGGVAILVAGASPIDQFLARHPDYFFDRSPEHARIDPDNLLILLDHVRCAAFELPFGDAPPAGRAQKGRAETGRAETGRAETGSEPVDRESADMEPLPAVSEAATGSPSPVRELSASNPVVRDLLGVLEAQGVVRHLSGTWYWLSDACPAQDLSLRSAGPGAIAIVVKGGSAAAGAPRDGGASRDAGASDDVGASRDAGAWDDSGAPDGAGARADVLGTVDRASAPVIVHPGAVYLHDGRAFVVESLDLESGRAVVAPTDGAIYTRASSRTDIRPLRTLAERDARGAAVAHGELEVRTRATGYRRVRFRTNETVGWGEIDLPEQVHVAGGYWFVLADDTVERLRSIGHWDHDRLLDRGPNWREQAALARGRDGFACRLCGAPEREGRVHDVHHIRPFRQFGWVKGANNRYRLANDLDNLITLCQGCHRVAERALGLQGGLSGVGYVLGHLAPLFLMCDARDLGVNATSHAPWSKRPTVVVYERAPAGVGFGEALYGLHERLIAAAIDLVADCPCAAGCPACVGPADAQGPDAKAHALAVLRGVGS